MELDRILEVLTRNIPENSGVGTRIGVQAANVAFSGDGEQKNRAPQLMATQG